jgi:hypothetical protein
MDSLSGTLVPVDTIVHYSITFTPVPIPTDLTRHFMLVFWNTEVGRSAKPPASIRDLLVDGAASHRDVREKGIVCVSAFRYTTASRTATLWMRSDVMEQMMAGKWRAFIWRTDTWEATTPGVDVSAGVETGKNWTMVS